MMSEEFEGGDVSVKEYGERTLNAARLHYLLRQETSVEDPWHTIVLAVCAFDGLHLKDGWEFVLTNKRDIEDVGMLFEQSGSPEAFREGLLELKRQDLHDQRHRRGLDPP